MVSNNEMSRILKTRRENFKNNNMISCKACNAKNLSNAKFCTKCGSKLVLEDFKEKTDDTSVELNPNTISEVPSKIVEHKQENYNFEKSDEDFKSTKKFDLNIEKILENWEVYHGIREIIANAIDEQILTGSKDMDIFKDENNVWHIRDYGRGLKYEHLTQNENEEKLENPQVIGKFGIGLKDALATFDRKGIKVLIKSRYGDIRVYKSRKHDFEDVLTLHAYISPTEKTNFVGTEFILENLTDEDIQKAKDNFLKFSGEKTIEETKYGDVLDKKGNEGRIYVNGVKVAEEENFMFSYNITSLTQKIKKALNRERTNVGRSAYSDRVKSILLTSRSKEIAQKIVNDLKNYSLGKMHDELKWLDVQEHGVKILNASEDVIFLTPEELIEDPRMVDEARSGGYNLITIPGNLKEKIKSTTDIHGNEIRDLGQFYKEYDNSFEFKFVGYSRLTENEREVFYYTTKIFKLLGGKPNNIKEIKISETMRKELGTFIEANGIWEPSTGRIIIKRSQLRSIEAYSGTLIHEIAHATSGARDVSREFELELTRLLGIIFSRKLISI
jgi:ribosomal protein L40E